MIDALLYTLHFLEDNLWGYVGFPLILLLGGILTWKSRAVQFRRLPSIVRDFLGYMTGKTSHEGGQTQGIHPLRAFFASIGGSLGIGNVVAVAAAMQIGGPGALAWIWVTSILGCLVKYAEVYIGIMHRRRMEDGSFKGGPMFFLYDAFQSKIPVIAFCVLLSLYGVEIYQFNVVASVSADFLGCSKAWTVLTLLGLLVYAQKGGLKRVSFVSTILVPCIIVLYLIMGVWVLIHYSSAIPGLLGDIFSSALTPRAAEGGFLGSTLLMTISQGVRRGCYSADIGVGYASIIHSESTNPSPIKQARLLIFEVLMDTFVVCTLSALLVLITGVWKQDIAPSRLVQEALSTHFPHMEIFMPILICLLGFSVVMTYLSSGMKSAAFLSSKYGVKIYALYACISYVVFSIADSIHAMSAMGLINFLLLFVNSLGIWKLRREILFDTEEEFAISQDKALPVEG